MITTQRLLLREVNYNDLSEIHLLHTLPESDEFNTMGIPESRKVTEKMVQDWVDNQKTAPRSEYILVIASLIDGRFIGMIAIKSIDQKFKSAEIWYKLLPDVWRKGLATEAVAAIIGYGFEKLHLHRIEAGCAVKNIASVKVMEKVGMIKEGRKRKALPIRGEWVDNFEYAILKSDWLAQADKAK